MVNDYFDMKKVNRLSKAIEHFTPGGMSSWDIARMLSLSFELVSYINDTFESIGQEAAAIRYRFEEDYEYILNDIFDTDDLIGVEGRIDAESSSKCFVYYVLNKERDKIKIGISNNPMSRARAIQTASGEEIEIINTIEFPDRQEALRAETWLHKRFRNERKRPSKVAKSSEWFEAIILDTLMAEFWTKEDIDRRAGFERKAV